MDWKDVCRIVVMPNGERWAVPAKIIINDRAHYMADKHPDEFPTLEDAIKDTEEYFADDDHYDLHDWAANNMNWEDVKEYAFKVGEPELLTEEQMQEAWCNGEHSVKRVKR